MLRHKRVKNSLKHTWHFGLKISGLTKKKEQIIHIDKDVKSVLGHVFRENISDSFLDKNVISERENEVKIP